MWSYRSWSAHRPRGLRYPFLEPGLPVDEFGIGARAGLRPDPRCPQPLALCCWRPSLQLFGWVRAAILIPAAWGAPGIGRPIGRGGYIIGLANQSGIGHQAAVVEGDLNAVGVLKWQHLSGAPCFWLVSCSKTIIPEAREHLFAASGH